MASEIACFHRSENQLKPVAFNTVWTEDERAELKVLKYTKMLKLLRLKLGFAQSSPIDEATFKHIVGLINVAPTLQPSSYQGRQPCP